MSSINFLSYEQHLEIFERYESGQNPKDIALVFNTHWATIYKYLKREPKLYQAGSQNLNHEFFKNIDTDEKAYWLGFMLADGNVRSNLKGLSLKLHIKDKNHIEKFQECLQAEDYKITYYKDNVGIEIYSKYLVNDLISHGVVPKKSLVVEWPKNISQELDYAIIRGIFDGDGSVFIPKDKIITYNIAGTYNLLNIIKEKLSLSNKLSKRPGCYVLKQAGRNVCKKFYDYIYKDATVWLPRKRKIFEDNL
ncbi:hypothetical protein KKE60_07100 [Patescibacteria group bacterium]|nr:hypothetical protein [Patescibacteria group bacterium]